MRERYRNLETPREGDLGCPTAQLDSWRTCIVDPYAYL